jgi:uncharacterized phage protein gp47/JayE
MSGLTSSGFERKILGDIKEEIQDSLKSVLGNSINLLPPSFLATIVGIFSERENLIWELAEDVYNSQYPDTASGISLDNVVAITGINRLEATFSTATVTLEGSDGTIVPAGTVFSVLGNTLARFVLDVEQIIPISGEIDATCTAESAGAVQAPSGTLTVIETPVAGLDSVTNALDAVVGRELETDIELRLRRRNVLQVAGAGTPEAIRSRLLGLENVTDVIVFENQSMIEDMDARPPKSYEAVVNGGLDADIDQAIWESKPAGISTYGNQNNSVIDSQGFTQAVNWSRPSEVDIWVEVDLTTDSEFPVDGIAQAEAAILAYGNGLGIGKDVIVYPQLMCALHEIAGITDVAIRVGLSASPTLDNNIVIAPNEIAKFDSSRILVIEL